MRIKHTVLIFLIGLLVGVSVSPFADSRPQQALLAPIPVTLADAPHGIVIENPTTQVLGDSDINQDINTNSTKLASPTPEEKTTVSQEVKKTKIPEKVEQNLASKKVTIAVFGDSMIDTMGTGLPYLEKALENSYPNIGFSLLNYGVGAQSVEQGLARLDQAYSYQDRSYPPLTNSDNADIIIIGSFSYNPFSDKDINYHWLKLAELVNKIRVSGKKVLLLAENAPAKSEFGTGPGGVNWPADIAWQHAEKIKNYLESTIRLSATLNIPLVDCYRPTLLTNGEGNQAYVNQSDHIHPSVAGHQFIAQKIAEKIFKENMIK